MAQLDDLAERVERLVMRHQELKRTTALIADQLLAVTTERDSLKSRLSAARARVDALLERLPAESGGKGTNPASTKPETEDKATPPAGGAGAAEPEA